MLKRSSTVKATKRSSIETGSEPHKVTNSSKTANESSSDIAFEGRGDTQSLFKIKDFMKKTTGTEQEDPKETSPAVRKLNRLLGTNFEKSAEKYKSLKPVRQEI